MPQLTFSQALTANQLGYNPVSGWQYETIPYQYANGAVCKLLVRATDANTRLTLYTGSQTIQVRSPIQGGGTAGTLPTDFDTVPQLWRAGPGDKLQLQIDEVAGGIPNVDGIIIVEPI